MSQSTTKDAVATSGMQEPFIDLFLPLADYEKELIVNFIRDMRWPSVVESLGLNPGGLGRRLHHAFVHWHWTKRFMDCFEEVSTEEKWLDFHQGDWKLIWDSIERVIPSNRTEADNFRFADLKAANDHLNSLPFAKDLCTRTMPRAANPDGKYWVVLSELLAFYDGAEPPKETLPDTISISPSSEQPSGPLSSLAFVPNIDSYVSYTEIGKGKGEVPENERRAFWENRWEFNIWSLLRACATILRRQPDSLDKVNEGVALTGFFDLHDRVWNGYVRNDKEREGTVFGYGYMLSATARRIYTFGDHPSKYVEYIPWYELEPYLPGELPDGIGDRRLVSWQPAMVTEWERHLFTEDDLLRASVMSGFHFPDERHDGSAVFALSPIADFDFETTAKGGFWGYWNDCAITQNPNSKEWHLLETVPGLRYRKLEQQFDSYAARAYFRALVEQKIQGRTEELKNVLGIHFQPKYQNLLTLIPPSQISDVQAKPIGEGTRGRVYKAIWNQPRGIGVSKVANLYVALKSIKVSEVHDFQKFLIELDRTFSAVSGLQGRLVDLHGLLRTPPAAQVAGTNACSILPPDTYFLVLEFALLGPLDDYLRQTLLGDASDWPLLIDLMDDIAMGLYYIHKRGVVHRDIHWRNVLVTKRPYPRGSGPIVYSTEALIADLGEAQLIDSQPHRRTYYGNQDFWAPEIWKSHVYSQASDVYAMGVLFSQMFSLHWNAVSEKNPQLPREVPLILIRMVMECLSEDPNQRPTAEDVFDSLEEWRVADKETWDACEKLNLDEVEIQGILQGGIPDMAAESVTQASEDDIED